MNKQGCVHLSMQMPGFRSPLQEKNQIKPIDRTEIFFITSTKIGFFWLGTRMR
jgi:hypothetical protein